jgi:hypothetical protein
MEDTKAIAILSTLAKGVNPSTGEVFPQDSPYQQADVVRALYVAIERLKQSDTAGAKPRSRAELPSNVGKPWTDDEDERLLAAFDRGRKPAEIARELGRTLAGIEARLEKHGRISAAERRTVNRFPTERRAPSAPAAR